MNGYMQGYTQGLIAGKMMANHQPVTQDNVYGAVILLSLICFCILLCWFLKWSIKLK